MLLFHVTISLVAMAVGFHVLAGMILGKRLDGPTAIFLLTTLLTSVSGLALPASRLLPSHIIAGLSLLALALAVYARYSTGMKVSWKAVYLFSAIFSLYLNVFVLLAQAFKQVPWLHRLAPTQSEAPFAVTQLLLLLAFIYLGGRARSGFAQI